MTLQEIAGRWCQSVREDLTGGVARVRDDLAAAPEEQLPRLRSALRLLVSVLLEPHEARSFELYVASGAGDRLAGTAASTPVLQTLEAERAALESELALARREQPGAVNLQARCLAAASRQGELERQNGEIRAELERLENGEEQT